MYTNKKKMQTKIDWGTVYLLDHWCLNSSTQQNVYNFKLNTQTNNPQNPSLYLNINLHKYKTTPN